MLSYCHTPLHPRGSSIRIHSLPPVLAFGEEKIGSSFSCFSTCSFSSKTGSGLSCEGSGGTATYVSNSLPCVIQTLSSFSPVSLTGASYFFPRYLISTAIELYQLPIRSWCRNISTYYHLFFASLRIFDLSGHIQYFADILGIHSTHLLSV